MTTPSNPDSIPKPTEYQKLKNDPERLQNMKEMKTVYRHKNRTEINRKMRIWYGSNKERIAAKRAERDQKYGELWRIKKRQQSRESYFRCKEKKLKLF